MEARRARALLGERRVRVGGGDLHLRREHARRHLHRRRDLQPRRPARAGARAAGNDVGDGERGERDVGLRIDRQHVERDPRVVRADLHELGARVRAHRLADAGAQLGHRVRRLHARELLGLAEARGVLVQPEDRRPAREPVDGHHVEHQGAALDRLREHVHGDLGPGHEPTVVPDLPLRDRHRARV